MDRLNLLALIVAMSAYLAGIRFATIGRLASLRSTDALKRRRMRRFLRFLIAADAPLIVAGLLITVDLFPNPILGKPAPAWCLAWAYRLFVLSVIILAGLHVASWLRAFQPAGSHTPAAAIAALNEEAARFEAETVRHRKELESLKSKAEVAQEQERQGASARTPPAPQA